MSYIGCTGQSLEARFKIHCSFSKRGERGLLYDAIRNHGVENFSIREVDLEDYKYPALEKEKQCIRKFDTIFPNGYNIYGEEKSVPFPESKKFGDWIRSELKDRSYSWLFSQVAFPFGIIERKASGYGSFTLEEVEKIKLILNTNY